MVALIGLRGADARVLSYQGAAWEPHCIREEAVRFERWARTEIARHVGLDPAYGPVDWFVLVVWRGAYVVVQRENLGRALGDGARVVYDSCGAAEMYLRRAD